MRRLLAVTLVVLALLAVAASVRFLVLPTTAAPADAAPTTSSSTPRPRGSGATGDDAGRAAVTSPIARPAGEVVIRAAAGSGPGQLGHRRDDEAAPEGPMSLAVAPSGDILVLDQVNGRIVRFDPDGPAEIPLGLDTAQDLVVGPEGDVYVLDRLGDRELIVLGPDGRPRDRIAVEGGPITEGGAVSGVFVGPDGVYLEREHTEVIRVAGPDGADPDRGSQPGRPTRDGRGFLSARIADAAAGVAVVRLWDPDGQVVWARRVGLGAPIVHLLLLDSDRTGHAYLGGLAGQESPDPPYALVDATTVVVRLRLDDGIEDGRLALPPATGGDEIFRELVVTDDGAILHMRSDGDEVTVTRYDVPGSP